MRRHTTITASKCLHYTCSLCAAVLFKVHIDAEFHYVGLVVVLTVYIFVHSQLKHSVNAENKSTATCLSTTHFASEDLVFLTTVRTYLLMMLPYEHIPHLVCR